MPTLNPSQPPPEGYYANNLLAVVESVCSQYDDLLTEPEKRFATTTQTLSPEALRLFARLVSRTKPLIRVDSLRYADVGDVPAAIDELRDVGFVEVNASVESAAILDIATIPEILRLFPEFSRRGRKIELVERATEKFDCTQIHQRVAAELPWLLVTALPEFELYCLLFFGNLTQRIDEFVIRDLGVARYEPYELQPNYRLFQERHAIERYLVLNTFAQAVETAGTAISNDDASVIYEELNEPETDRVFEMRRSGILNVLGRNLERVGNVELALQCYRASSRHPARERTMRILHKQERIDEVEEMRRSLLNAPRCYEERQFAMRFKRPRAKQVALPTQVSDAPTPRAESIEEFAAARLGERGYQAWHLENALPMGLFALAYWEWLFAPVRGAFVNPFQSAPLDLHWPEFFDARRAICDDPLAEPSELKERIAATANRKAGISCQLVAWKALTPEVLSAVLEAMTTEQLVCMLRIATEDLRQFRAGFPDLTVIDPSGHIEFVEVKGPGDQLRPNQRLWIERLMQASIPVHVWRLK